jgi:DNA-binding transcriptional regulator YiaG
MKTCTCCGDDLPLDCFSFQKRNPGKMYAWCDNCRSTANDVKMVVTRKNNGYGSEIAILRAKTQQLRKLSDEQVAEMKKHFKAGMGKDTLARMYNVSQPTVHKWLSRA